MKTKNETVKRIGKVPYWLLNQRSKMVLNASYDKLLYIIIDSTFVIAVYYVCVNTHGLGEKFFVHYSRR